VTILVKECPYKCNKHRIEHGDWPTLSYTLAHGPFYEYDEVEEWQWQKLKR
jgi:hypothetical protein